MATVNLGSIKFKWKGTYNGATAYTIDDVIEYNGSSYICKLASTGNLPTNTTYFDQMSAKGTDGTNGTNGTDLTTTLTTQGDLVYRDGSGLQRLGAGTSGQVLQTGGAGANPSWGTVSSEMVKLVDTNFDGSTIYNNVENVFDSQYSHFIIKLINVRRNTPSTGNLKMRFGTGATPAYRTSGYTRTHKTSYVYTPAPSSSFTDGYDINDNAFTLTSGLSIPGTTDADVAMNFHIELWDLNNNFTYKRFWSRFWGGQTASYFGWGISSGTSLAGSLSDAVTGVQFWEATTTYGLLGTIKLYGVK